MSPHSSDNASQSKQKKKTGSPPTIPVDKPSTAATSTAASTATSTSASSPPVQPVSIAAAQPATTNSGPAQPAASISTAPDAQSPPRPLTASNPRVFTASTLKPVSAIDTVTSTISAISQQANRGISSLIAAHSNLPNATSPLVSASADHSTPLRTDGSVSPIYDAFHNAGSTPDPAPIDAALKHANHLATAARPALPRVLWSRWDRLPLKAQPPKWAPLLISYFDDGTLQALLAQDRQISELLCLPKAAEVLRALQLLTAFVRHPLPDSSEPQLMLVLQEPNKATHLLAYSLTTHQIQASVQLQHHVLPPSDTIQSNDARIDDIWQQVSSQCNERFLVLSFASPASIHVLSTATLQYLHSPILDAAAANANRPPPISLSHRLLAFACTTSQAISPVGEMRDNLFETSAHVGDAARRIRGGVMSGVRTLGEWGSSYWPHAGSPPTTTAFSPPKPSLLSQSAPHYAHPSRSASSASSSPMLLASDGGRNPKRLSTGATAALPVITDATAKSAASNTNAVQAGCLRILDLASDARIVCTFAPSTSSLAFVAFSPCGRMMLTADILAHAFHVFELHLAGAFGGAGTPSSSTVLHRYKLMRGITTADVVQAQWSSDAQWITVGTRSGTVHVYAVNPYGGSPSIANHVQRKIKNPQLLQPLGVSLASLARSTRPSLPPQQETALKQPGAPAVEAEASTAAASQMRFSPPSFLLVGHGARRPDADSEASSPFELLTNDPRGHRVTLHSVRCWSTQARAPSSSSTREEMPSTSPEVKQRIGGATSPRSSGLSQMMRKAGEGLLAGQQLPRLQAECVRVALWEHLAPENGGPANKQALSTLSDGDLSSRSLERSHEAMLAPLAAVAKAEIETHSQSPAIVPTSIFLSRQTYFHSRTRVPKSSFTQADSSESLRCIQRRGSKPIQVRRTARMVSRKPLSEASSSFDDSLGGALEQMSFDPDRLPPRSASAHIPSFPQGQRGRSSGWTSGSSIPIRIVAGGLGGIYRAGKELGRGVEMARRRTSGASGTVAPDLGRVYPAARTASISFGGDDDIDLLGDDEDAHRSSRRLYGMDNNASTRVEDRSVRSDASLLSALRSDGPLRGSQPSSAETPSLRFSETEDTGIDGVGADSDECDWDAIEASRSPAAPEAPLFDVMDLGEGNDETGKALANTITGSHAGNSIDEDFTVGMLDEDSGQATMNHSRSSLSTGQGTKSKVTPPKELVYALPSGGSTRSSLLSHSSNLTTTADVRADGRDHEGSSSNASPSNSGGADSGSQGSPGSGLLCEGSKETYTTDSSPAGLIAELEPRNKDVAVKETDGAIMKKPISTFGGGKKKRGGR
ncbi:hypothetical protein NDA17_002618 [Ustilago hordei]|nr:hypothetical protein NDA17_002618 [Ustilago hordei]